jgi:hypothetical protein
VVARIIDPSTFEPVAKIPLVAHATADVLPSDPVTIGGPHIFKATRPHRPSAAFAGYLDTVPLWKAKRAATANRVLLEDTGGYFRILEVAAGARFPSRTAIRRRCRMRYGRRANQRICGCQRVCKGERIHSPNARLRFRSDGRPSLSTFPLAIHYRGGIYPGGRDGKTINAQVRWISLPADASGAAVPGTAEVSFARGFAAPAPLGIAADARWAWHEWSHVMLAGATGSLEFEVCPQRGRRTCRNRRRSRFGARDAPQVARANVSLGNASRSVSFA